jgi:hypothetical protein
MLVCCGALGTARQAPWGGCDQRRPRFAMTLLLGGLVLMTSAASLRGQDEQAEPSKADSRMKVMREAIDKFRVTSAEIKSEGDLKFSERPLLRYNDQTRESGQGIQGVLDATVWRLGESGRPKAIVTLEIYQVRDGNPLLTYEFVSLTPQKFQMRNLRGPTWLPEGTQLEMAVLPGAAAPAEKARTRLIQMRELARRFTAQEKLGPQKIECRLLAQPIDRYEDGAAGIVDGAVFAFANGTNPEMGMLLECSDKQWSYGIFRLASAVLFVQLDGKPLIESRKLPGYGANLPYTATRHPIVLPE